VFEVFVNVETLKSYGGLLFGLLALPANIGQGLLVTNVKAYLASASVTKKKNFCKTVTLCQRHKRFLVIDEGEK
jgi:hypothetical protein